jgi:two-component system OmpR family response regulator
VRIPAVLAPLLDGPLRDRGLAVVQDGAAAVVVSRLRPEPGARWVALADDNCATLAALDDGADDAVSLCTWPAVIAARIARLARPLLLRAGPLAIDPVARRAWRDGRPLDLLPREYAVLLHLAQQADRLVTRAELRTGVWGRDFDPGTNVIEVHVSRVRAQLDRGLPPMLLTERGRGYRLVSDPAIADRRRAS